MLRESYSYSHLLKSYSHSYSHNPQLFTSYSHTTIPYKFQNLNKTKVSIYFSTYSVYFSMSYWQCNNLVTSSLKHKVNKCLVSRSYLVYYSLVNL
jgi:hypothetical protein